MSILNKIIKLNLKILLHLCQNIMDCLHGSTLHRCKEVIENLCKQTELWYAHKHYQKHNLLGGCNYIVRNT